MKEKIYTWYIAGIVDSFVPRKQVVIGIEIREQDKTHVPCYQNRL